MIIITTYNNTSNNNNNNNHNDYDEDNHNYDNKKDNITAITILKVLYNEQPCGEWKTSF